MAVDYYTRHEERQYAARSLLYKGLVHKQRKEVEKAAEAFALSEQWFEGVDDNQYKALLFNHYASLMRKEENFEKALHYFKESYKLELKGDSIHYILSSCGAIANVFIYMRQMDSAQVYFERGLALENNVPPISFYIFQQNYANFLRKNKDYVRAEQMLLECERYMTDSLKYTVYSSLTTLYYDMQDYDKGLEYAEKILGSRDSVVLRGGFIHLYRIHKKLGNMAESLKYHELYRQYDNDITMRLKTVELAVIPHYVKTKLLHAEIQKRKGAQWKLLFGLSCLLSVILALFVGFRKKYKKKQQQLQSRLVEDDKVICDMSMAQSEKNKEIGLLHYQMERKNKQIEHMGQLQKDRLQKERDKIKEKKDEIDLLRKRMSDIEGENEELRDIQRKTVKENKRLHEIVHEAEHDEQIKKQIALLQLRGTDKRTIGLLVQLKHGNLYVGEQIPQEEVWPLITALLDDTLPEMRQRMDALTGNPTKRMMCYLMALELDDEEMMYRATGKRLETIRKYHKECRQLVDSLIG